MVRLVELVVVALALAFAFAPLSAGVVERWFSGRVYPRIQHTLTPATNALPLAVFDILFVAALVAVVVVLTRGSRAAWKSRRLKPVLLALGHVVAAAAFVYLVFLGAWGFNYRRVPMSERLDMARGAPASEEVVQLGLRAVAEMNRLHDQAHRVGWPADEWQHDELRTAFAEVQRALGGTTPAVPGRLKPTMFGAYFRWVGVDGMINPFGLEVLANPDLLPFERPFVAAHEWAHLAGYAHEAEANFVGWLTAQRADATAQYSAWLFLYWQVSGEVGDQDRKVLAAALGPGPNRDVAAIVARLRQGTWPMLQRAGWAAYDQYLKANRVDEGIRSYGEVVTLILRARFDDGWIPVRRDARESSR
jgi:hypothetical protein